MWLTTIKHGNHMAYFNDIFNKLYVRYVCNNFLPALIDKYTTINNNYTMAMRTSKVGPKNLHVLMWNPEIFVWLIMFREERQWKWLITRVEESYLLCVCLILCDLETSQQWDGLSPSCAFAPQKYNAYSYTYFYIEGHDISVGIANCYGVEFTGIESRSGRDFPHPSLGPTQSPI